jgi:hypothetical protein
MPKLATAHSARDAKRGPSFVHRAAWLALFVAGAVIFQVTPAAACHEDWSWWHKAADPAGYAFCKYVFGHFDTSGTGPDREQPPGFEAPLPDNSGSANLPDPNEKRCLAKPVCATGYRTFCVSPVGASPPCCHAWRTCEKKF